MREIKMEAEIPFQAPGANVVSDYRAALHAVIDDAWDDADDLASWVAALQITTAEVQRNLIAVLIDEIRRKAVAKIKPYLCRYADCKNGFSLAADAAGVTCPVCREWMGLPDEEVGKEAT